MSAPDGKKPKSKAQLPFLVRTQAMGASGWEGYTVGFTLVGCIVAGAGLGWLLDNHFKTSFWLPILFLVGVVGGFREMFLVLKRVGAEQDRKRREKSATTPLVTDFSTREKPESPIVPTEIERKRIFSVPPPPLAGQTIPEIRQDADSESVEDILKRLMESDEKPDGETPESDDPSSSKKA